VQIGKVHIGKLLFLQIAIALLQLYFALEQRRVLKKEGKL
jgi:hypothetical protein